MNDVPENSSENDDQKMVQQLRVYSKDDTPEMQEANSKGVYSADIESIAT